MADPPPSQPKGTSQPARQYRPSRGRRVGDTIISVFIRARPYFQAAEHASVEDFIAEADRHPVFELTPLTRDHPDGG